MSKCGRCVYRAGSKSLNKCDYILLTGHSRGCPTGEDCTVFQPGKRLGKPKPLQIKGEKKVTKMPKGKRVEIDSDRALKLVAEGLTDLQIAERLGIGLSTWRNYKRRNGWTDPVHSKDGSPRKAPPTEQEEAPEPTAPPETLVEEAPPSPGSAQDGGPIKLSVCKSGYSLTVEAENLDALATAQEDFVAMLNAWI